ncbi:hypothetical protein S40285_00859 [Stachybotrys chlorohalonatus IBT 40285]|uniref:PhoD-like phosphatase domain-containing protein n=1 Tax=Stachybotrys chlorohalonatus (strain IBT 40285) TaxID=1283841 RepID=A0A084QJS0_STAC4|nr:hypothetical protein S40285_00859 [Stachybotrys chlorohalonata IBT 40285]
MFTHVELGSPILVLYASSSHDYPIQMASYNEEIERPRTGEPNPYASQNKWRHQESTAYARYAGSHSQAQPQARDPVANSDTGDLANFLNKTRIEPPDDRDDRSARGNFQPITIAAGHSDEHEFSYMQPTDGRGEANDGKEIVCGPLLNYRRMDDRYWYGSVLVVIKGGGMGVLYQPSLILRRVGQAGPPASGEANGTANGHSDQGSRIESHRLYSDPRNTFWAFDITVPIEAQEIKYEYSLPDMRYSSEHKPRVNTFYIPAADESMRIMFHSCNGFSVGTDEDAWSGAALWNDVIRKHSEVPFHVMVGGGDQIYNDGIRVNGPLREWTAIQNPRKRREYPFPEKLRAECDDYYLKNYIRWYNTDPFAGANGQIAQLNIWDDHDASFIGRNREGPAYTDDRSSMGLAHMWMALCDAMSSAALAALPTSIICFSNIIYRRLLRLTLLLMDTYVAPPRSDPGYILGHKPGPYVAEHSVNIYARLGARMALAGIDARTERTRHQVNYPETYDLIFNRLHDELNAAASVGRPIKHLILLLGIPIAYPRLTWLENVLRSPFMGPVKFLNRRFGVGGGFFNHFDGSVDLLDDLDDHYTAKTHKPERQDLIVRLQELSARFSVRVTILGGDVHLAALGRFYSNPKLQIPAEHDARYMANVISSAIVNKPPPAAVANLLARRNKIHHLNHDTDETLLDLFEKDPGDSNKTANFNNCTMPSRNFAMITENSPNNPALNGTTHAEADVETRSFNGNDGHSQLHRGEVKVGTMHKAATIGGHGRGNDGSLDICINVEIDQHDRQGRTEGYGMTVPTLDYRKHESPAHEARSVEEHVAQE